MREGARARTGRISSAEAGLPRTVRRVRGRCARPPGPATLMVECQGDGCDATPIEYAHANRRFKALQTGSVEWMLAINADELRNIDAGVYEEDSLAICLATATFGIDVGDEQPASSGAGSGAAAAVVQRRLPGADRRLQANNAAVKMLRLPYRRQCIDVEGLLNPVGQRRAAGPGCSALGLAIVKTAKE